MQSRASVLFVVLLLSVGAAVAVFFAENRRPHHDEAFQRLVGGLGFETALDLTGCAFAFDPRLDAGCEQERGPIPGGACFCPRHAGSIFFYPPLEHGVELPGDALSP